ncbi:MAG TPA: Lrp/AsnC family transcriptional regulator, partial [Bacteroidales bacterium]|nr:Lrp/AsnC family transcriptional regulator [Bacteroidales bacterium]
MPKYQIDQIDQKILSFLVKNARMPFLEIARECGVSGAAIHQRVKKMENLGIITGSRLLVKPQALGLNVCAYVGVSLSQANQYPSVIEALKKIPEVVECHFVTGKHALMLKIYCQ